MSLSKALQKALSTSAGSGGDFLPTPLALQFIKYVRDKNFLRQAFTVTPMKTKTKDYPKILGNTKVYYQPTEGGTSEQADLDQHANSLLSKKHY